MRKRALLILRILILLPISAGSESVSSQLAAAKTQSSVPVPKENAVPTITVRAASGATIGFKTQNGQTTDGIPAQSLDLPYLVLYRNGTLTRPDERTLIVTVSDLVLPTSGVTVTLTLQTHHSDPDLDGTLESRITVWSESVWLDNSPALDRTTGTFVFEHEFGASVRSGVESIATPTDYFRYDLTIVGAGPSALSPMYTFSQDHAFLMENQWTETLNLQQVGYEGTVPEELVVYYCDMFVFQRDIQNPASRLERAEIPRYVQQELVLAMLEAIRIQTEEWGFAWRPDWTSYRAEDGQDRLSVALSDGEIWFHGEAPTRGHSAISIRTKGGTNRNYGTLTDGLLSTFHHELFHNLQKGMAHEFGGHGDVDGETDAWGFFAEGTAVLAESVAQPITQFIKGPHPRTYISHANGFIGRTSFHGELNGSYARMTPYRAAIYWRFLYEQCGGMNTGAEAPGAGMRIIRESLRALYSGELVDISPSTDLAQYLPAVLDGVLKGPKARLCPFQSFRESLQHFARAIYLLRLDGGRCTAPGIPAGCSFYDPNNLYVDPPVSIISYNGEQIIFDGAEQPYPRGIRSSFGIDFVDVVLEPGAQGQPLTIEFSGAPEGDAEFGVEIWKLVESEFPGGSRQSLFPVAAPEQLARQTTEGPLLYTMPELDITETNRLGLIIIRLDSKENMDPVGAYTIALHPGHGL